MRQIVFVIFTSVCMLLAACGQTKLTEMTSAKVEETSAEQQTLIYQEFAPWLKKNHGLSFFYVLKHAVEVRAIRARVKAIYGDLSPNQFCRYFASAEFKQLAKRLMREPEEITYEPDWGKIPLKKYSGPSGKGHWILSAEPTPPPPPEGQDFCISIYLVVTGDAVHVGYVQVDRGAG